MRTRTSLGDKIFEICNTIFMILLIISTAYPFIYIVSVSLSSAHAVQASKVVLLPVDFSVVAYKMVLDSAEFWNAYKNTLIYVVGGTLFQMLGTTMLAYPLSKSRLVFRNFISYLSAFTMYFGGGMVPWFILLTKLGLRNTEWGMIIPGAISVFNAILLRTYFQSNIPIELEESAKIDGMGNVGILTRIYMPLSKPIYATLILFVTVGIWNSYFDAILLLDDRTKYPLQVYLRNLIASGEISHTGGPTIEGSGTIVPDTLKGAAIVVSMLPIMMVYPFIQKHFVKGVLVGSIKG